METKVGRNEVVREVSLEVENFKKGMMLYLVLAWLQLSAAEFEERWIK